MGLGAGPGWPEAGLGTKPPGSPYLGRGRWAAPRGSPHLPGPATPSPQGPSPGLGAAAGPPLRPRTAPLRDNGPPPPPRGGEIQRERSAARQQARRPESEDGGERQGKGEDGGGRGSPRAALPAVQGAALSPAEAAEAGAQTSSHSTPAEKEEGSAHKEEWSPHPPLTPEAGMAQSALAADGQRRPPCPRPSPAGVRAGRPSPKLTHSSVPQLMAELEATRAVWLLRCPSVCRICP